MATRTMQLRRAKAELSAVVDEAVKGNATVITRYGKPQAVLVKYEDWESGHQSFADLLLAFPGPDAEVLSRWPDTPRELEL
ncbi:MAG: type II toxin-antitoxin system Phd/YefM family antitoxin [Hyphomonadaceae bacterium]|jgi:antitoxin Phd|nr:type II toxin-antitoxin system Phd/YefM family antitoxin [Hyphomonadaceae bacterium]